MGERRGDAPKYFSMKMVGGLKPENVFQGILLKTLVHN